MSETKFTPGPWQWAKYDDGRVYLATPDRGRLIVMDFVRKGLNSAQPRFAKWEGGQRERLGGIMYSASEMNLAEHPDAALIAAAPELYEALRGGLNELLAYCGEEENDDTPTGYMIKMFLAALSKANPTTVPGNPKLKPL